MGIMYNWAFIMILCLIPLLDGCSAWRTSCLVVSDAESGRVVARLPVNPREPIIIEFVNSIYLAPVWETLVYEPQEDLYIVMVESPSEDVFRYYGLEPDSTGKVMLHRKVGKVRLRSIDYSSHRIKAGNSTLKLKEVVQGGESLLLDVKDCSE